MLGWGFKFLLTIPLAWAFILAILDYSKNIEALFFARTLDRIYKKKDHIRDGCRKKPENCPIFKVLKKYNPTSDINYSRNVGNIPIARVLAGDVKDDEKACVIWSLIRGMGANYQQAAFFEIVVIQFFVAFLMIDSGVEFISYAPPGSEILIKNFY